MIIPISGAWVLLKVNSVKAINWISRYTSRSKAIKWISVLIRACSQEPGTMNYPGVMIAQGQALPRVHIMVCCPGSTSLIIAPWRVHRHLIITKLSEFL